ncbi:helix-turn-helix domain-containing protein [Streptomyces milbemycinicus]|uniref:Helix-turn-helix domain-containing protein n=1 Tax=Streptomyces milbemycinicus TaxID=476552 RepID=A0ABW8LS12_9ACTN
MPAGGKPTVRSRRLGAALKRYRLAAKLDQQQAAAVLEASAAKISRVESGHVTARVVDIRLLLEAYGVKDGEVRAKLENLARNANRRGWWLEHAAHLREDYLDHIAIEDDATFIREWQPVMFPGLLQTPAYAAATIAAGPNCIDPERATHLVKARETRQAKIEPGGAAYTAILWEPVIINPLVSVAVHRGQLSAVIEVSERQNVTVQVLPFTAGLLAGISAFSSFSFDSDPAVEAVTMENLRGTSVLEDPGDLGAYANAFDQLRSAAMAPDASARLIRGALRSSEEGK